MICRKTLLSDLDMELELILYIQDLLLYTITQQNHILILRDFDFYDVPISNF